MATRKPPLSSTNTAATNLNRRSQPTATPAAAARIPTRSPTPNSGSPLPAPAVTTGIIARRNTIREPGSHRNSVSSPLSARSAVKRPQSSHTHIDEVELENTAILEELRARLTKCESAAEAAAEDYTMQLKALQARLEEALVEQVKMEDNTHAKDEVIEGLEIQVKELTRAKRDQENIYEAERTAAVQEKEEMLDREEELNTIVQRLKDSLSQRERLSDFEGVTGRTSMDSSSSAEESSAFAPSNSNPSPARNNNLLLQKDKLIESLRLELAEAQIRLAEADHMGGTKMHHLEQQLLETRMTNARLMEDNESFQLLLSSATLNGDFSRGDFMSNAFSELDPEPETDEAKKVPGSPRNSISLGSNLAEELEEAAQGESEKYRKLEGELRALKDQNKAMSLYINNIIERILLHKDSEAILDKTTPLGGDATIDIPANTDKALPATPKEMIPEVKRTKSLAARRVQGKPMPIVTSGISPLQRSQSMRITPQPSSHRRSASDATPVYPGANVVNNIYRGEGMITSRTNAILSGGGDYTGRNRKRDSSASVHSAGSDGASEHSLSSHPIAGNKLRPLRLVQENVGNGMMSPPLGGRKISGDYKMDDEDEKTRLERRSSKRGSWMGWFNRKEEGGPGGVAESVVFERKDVE